MAKAKKSNKDSTESLRRQLKDLSRELEIEAALEKVRSKAMSMRSSDMLAGTSAVMFQQIKALGIDATRCGVGIFDDANDAMEVWLTTASAGDKVMRVLDYVNLHIHPVYENILAARKKKKPYAITVLQGEEVRNYYNTMSVYMAGTGRKAVNKAEAYQSFFFDQGTINITTANPLSEDERSIMVRFAKVFGLIYLRFVDLQKAEAQASEARIEASLERVRSRSLAMRKSQELSDVAVILYKELSSLGLTNFFNCGFVEVDTQANFQCGWMTLPKGKRVEGFKLPLVGDPVLQERYEAWQRQDPVFYQSVGGAELKEHLKFVRLTIGSEDVDKKVTTKLPDPTVFYAFNFSHGYLHILSDGLLNADEELLATRFAKVFEIAYRRFLDLKVAEAQAQEAQIEAALERIRSRSLAMQRSEELMEVADVLREQMAMLGQAELETSALHFYKEVPGHIVSWRAFRLGSKTKGKITKGRMLIPNDACALVKEWLNNFHQNLPEYTVEVNGAKQREWYKVLFRLAPEVGEAMVKQKATTETRYYHFSRFSGGALLMVAIKKPSEESIYLQRRAASVFDLAYRRFLDLKVAEAQAREAQIEAALEKVRSHSLAMQRSEQLRDVIRVVMEQFSKLGIPADLANFNFYTRTNDWSMWLARPGFAYAEKIHLPYIQHPLFDAPVKSALKGATLYSDVLTRAEGRSAMKHLLRHTLVGKDPEAIALMKKANGLARSIVFGSKIMLTISRYDAIPYDEEQNSILTRFANVFEQAYTRFLDLQKAETQAREAQIELALERIRARTMAMQKSEELAETAYVYLQQFKELGQSPEQFTIGLINETKRVIEFWHTWQGSLLEGKVEISIDEPHVGQKMYNTWKGEQRSAIIDLSGKELRAYNTYRKKQLAKANAKAPAEVLRSEKRRIIHIARFSKGTISVTTHEPQPAETFHLLERFAKVFDQTYTRFLDLQRAEAQAREAQIEAALERVRSRSMAMHKSEELLEVINVLSEQLQLLKIRFGFVAFGVMSPEGALDFWMASPGLQHPERIYMPSVNNPLTQTALEARQKGVRFFANVFTPSETREWMEVLSHHNPSSQIVGQSRAFWTDGPGFARSAVLMRDICVFIGNLQAKPLRDEDNHIVVRFANVFEQTYTRFLDLQKAEAQAREAQIEAALERVRASTMAMHKSEQLLETAKILFEQFGQLGKTPDRIGIGIMREEKEVVEWWVTHQKGTQATHLFESSIQQPTIARFFSAWKAGSDSITVDLEGTELKEWIRFVREDVKMPLDDSQMKGKRVHHAAFFTHGLLLISHHDHFPEEAIQLLIRFAKVFGQTYTRFLDLQKAEAQAREAQIEAALERVRASMMAMHSSDGLPETMKVIAEQLTLLGVRMESVSFLPVSTGKDLTMWSANAQRPYPIQLTVPYFDHPIFNIILQGMADGSDFKAFSLSAEENRRWWMHFFSVPEISHVASEERKAYLLNGKSLSSSIVFRKNICLNINNYQNFYFSDEENSILKRFANVFEQAYVRFQDIERAEAQAREAQLEAALERVRSKAMAMHNSSDLPSTAIIAFAELKKLGFVPIRGGISIHNKENRKNLLYSATHSPEGDTLSLVGWAVLDNHPVLAEVYDKWLKGEDYFPELRGESLKAYYDQVRNSFPVPLEQTEHDQFGYFMHFTHGVFYGWCSQPVREDEKKLLRRFAAVVDLTFKRYFDLQRAEEQAREAQVEAALERARSRSLAMHKSTEIEDVVAVVFTQLQQLGLNFEVIGIATRVENTNDLMCWIGNDQHSYANRFLLPYTDFGAGRDILAAMDDKAPFFSKVYSFEEKNRFWSHAFANSGFKGLPEARKQYILQSPSFSLSVAPVNGVVLLLIDYSGKVATDQESELVKRFARVFEQCYVRFQDLEKVEAQAREATIQASLERVRAKAMAMHSSQDLAETIYAFYSELVSLNLTPRRAGLGLINKETRLAELSAMSTTEAGISVEVIGELLLENHPVLEGVYDHWLRQAEYRPVLRGNEIKKYFQVLRKNLAFPDYPNDAVQFGYFFFFEDGGIYAWTDKELQEDELNIYRRFTSVLSLTYRRYKDLKDSEARAKEAVKQASLDRVRAEIASMRHADDLQRITPLVWRELTTLGVPFFRCGVMIVHEKEHHVDFYLSTPEGKPLAALHLDSNGQEVTRKAMDHWRRQSVYTDHWDRAQFAAFAQDMVKAGQVQNASAYQGGELPPESMTLQFSPFAQGMLYVGSEHPLSTEQLELVHALADAFSTAYARYEDFTRLESAKATVERALSELRTTQNQLVQSEKMASLGELTAGIAHEIQNPLNFVNNFSEVSKELLEEMEAELKNGNQQDALQIAKDIIQNLEKINLHGKRADGIVKSMLQHSRKSTGQKELTDINALCDEYLRLAYHGLRAKDKSFNAKFETDFDPAVGQISVLPQEIGRVVLNLINNAFYAVSEKKKLNLNGYEPTVTVTTKKTADKIEIQVKDNGTGIPQKALDKIFQPFFTTKPTGQGTGLGLSLSYDIVKVHGGQLTVATADGSGTTFTILLNAT